MTERKVYRTGCSMSMIQYKGGTSNLRNEIKTPRGNFVCLLRILRDVAERVTTFFSRLSRLARADSKRILFCAVRRLPQGWEITLSYHWLTRISSTKSSRHRYTLYRGCADIATSDSVAQWLIHVCWTRGVIDATNRRQYAAELSLFGISRRGAYLALSDAS